MTKRGKAQGFMTGLVKSRIAGIIVIGLGILAGYLSLVDDGHNLILAGIALLVVSGGQEAREVNKKVEKQAQTIQNVAAEVHELSNGGLTKAVNAAIQPHTDAINRVEQTLSDIPDPSIADPQDNGQGA